MKKSREESLLSAVEDFSPQPSPTPADVSDSERDEREEEEPLGFGVRSHMVEPLSTASSAAKPAEMQVGDKDSSPSVEGESVYCLAPLRWAAICPVQLVRKRLVESMWDGESFDFVQM